MISAACLYIFIKEAVRKLMIILILFILLIVLFLKGMSMLRKGLISLTFEKIEKRLLFFTDHPVKAFWSALYLRGFAKQLGIYGDRHWLCLGRRPFI